MIYFCDTHEIQGKSRELLGLGIKVILTYITIIMGCHVYGITLGAAGVGYNTQPLRNPNIL